MLDALSDTGLDANTWVVFFTDHGPAFPRAKSTLYDAGTGIALIVRPPTASGLAPRVYDELFSGVDLVPTLLGLLGVEVPADVEGVSHADALSRIRTLPNRCAITCTPRRPTTTHSIRSGRFAPRTTATSRTTFPAHCWTCRGTSSKARPDWPSHRRSRRRDPSVNSTICAYRSHREQPICWSATRPRRLPGHECRRSGSCCSTTRLAPAHRRRHPLGFRRHPHRRSDTPKRICRSIAPGPDQQIGHRRRPRYRRRGQPGLTGSAARRPHRTCATTNTRRNGKMVVPSGRGG